MKESQDTPVQDMVRKPVSAFIWWCVPIAVGVLAATVRLPGRELASVWAVAFAWMATGCFLNALRCHRLHCYISGPAFLAGAVASGLLGAGVVPFAANALNLIMTATVAVVLASFLPEMLWRKCV